MSMHDPPDPDALLRRARAGEEDAVGRLLECYRRYLMLLGRVQIGRHLQGKADAADLVQETFLEAFRNWGQFRGTSESELLGWLRQILASRLHELVRRYIHTRGRDVRREQALAADLDQSSRVLDPDLIAPQSTPSHQAARREQAVILADALEQLPEDYREVIVLHHMEGCTLPEVARRMNRTVRSVEKLWARALAKLRRTLGDTP